MPIANCYFPAKAGLFFATKTATETNTLISRRHKILVLSTTVPLPPLQPAMYTTNKIKFIQLFKRVNSIEHGLSLRGTITEITSRDSVSGGEGGFSNPIRFVRKRSNPKTTITPVDCDNENRCTCIK